MSARTSPLGPWSATKWDAVVSISTAWTLVPLTGVPVKGYLTVDQLFAEVTNEAGSPTKVDFLFTYDATGAMPLHPPNDAASTGILINDGVAVGSRYTAANVSALRIQSENLFASGPGLHLWMQTDTGTCDVRVAVGGECA